MSELQPGSLFAGYRIAGLLGRGAMGAVFRARREKDGREVALKVLAEDLVQDPEVGLRFEREGKAALAISHPNVVSCHERGDEGGKKFLAFELVPGGSLDDFVKKRGALPAREAARLGAQVARGLAAIHAAGVIHRDLKPANVLLAEGGDAKVADFGLVGATVGSGPGLEQRLTVTGELVGSPAYMAPEQVNDARRADAKSDLYALGCLVFELLTGQPPFEGGKFVVLRQHLEKAAAAPSARVEGVPAALDRLVVALLAKKPEERPASATEVAVALEKIARGGGSGRGALLAALGLVVAGVAALALALVLRGPSSPPPAPPAPPASPSPPPAALPPDQELPVVATVRAEAERLDAAGKAVEALAAWSRVLESVESSQPLAAEARARLHRLARKAPRATGAPAVFKVKALVFEHTDVPNVGKADLTDEQFRLVAAAIEEWKRLVDELTRGVVKLECEPERVAAPVTRLARWSRDPEAAVYMPVPYDLPVDLRSLRKDYDSVIACVPFGDIARWGLGGGDFRGLDEGISYIGFALGGSLPTGLDLLRCWLGTVRRVLMNVQGWPEPAWDADAGTRRPLSIAGEPELPTREACERIMTEHVTERMWRELSARTIHPNPWNKGDVHAWRFRKPVPFDLHEAGVGLQQVADVTEVAPDAEVIESPFRDLCLHVDHPGDFQAIALETWVSVPVATTVKFFLGHDDGAELLVNGKSVWMKAGGHQIEWGEPVEGELAQGWSRLCAHLENETNGWGLSLRIRDRNGQPIPGIQLSVRH